MKGSVLTRAPVRRGLMGGAAVLVSLCWATHGAQAAEPIKIGVIGEELSVAGASITKAAARWRRTTSMRMGASTGARSRSSPTTIILRLRMRCGLFSAPPDQDKVAAVIGSYISEVALAIEPWSARLHMPYITPGRRHH